MYIGRDKNDKTGGPEFALEPGESAGSLFRRVTPDTVF
jgi:hypothetical protein